MPGDFDYDNIEHPHGNFFTKYFKKLYLKYILKEIRFVGKVISIYSNVPD
jgi:hypothetical protein